MVRYHNLRTSRLTVGDGSLRVLRPCKRHGSSKQSISILTDWVRFTGIVRDYFRLSFQRHQGVVCLTASLNKGNTHSSE